MHFLGSEPSFEPIMSVMPRSWRLGALKPGMHDRIHGVAGEYFLQIDLRCSLFVISTSFSSVKSVVDPPWPDIWHLWPWDLFYVWPLTRGDPDKWVRPSRCRQQSVDCDIWGAISVNGWPQRIHRTFGEWGEELKMIIDHTGIGLSIIPLIVTVY